MSDNVKVHTVDMDDLSSLPESIRNGILSAIRGESDKNSHTTISCLASAFFLSLIKSNKACKNSCFGNCLKNPAASVKDLTDITIMAVLPMTDDANFKSESNTAAPAICLASAIESGFKYAANGKAVMTELSGFEKAVLMRTSAERIVDLYCTGKIEHDMYANAAMDLFDKCIKAAYANTLDGYNSHLSSLTKALFSALGDYTYGKVKEIWLENESFDINSIDSIDMALSDITKAAIKTQTYDKARETLIKICKSLWMSESVYGEASFAMLLNSTAEKLAMAMQYAIFEKSTYGISMAAQHLSNKLIRDSAKFIASCISKEDAEQAFGDALDDIAENGGDVNMKLARNTALTFLNNAYSDIEDSVNAKAKKNSKVMTKFADEYPDRLFDIICPFHKALAASKSIGSNGAMAIDKEFADYVNKTYSKGKNVNV